MISRIGDGYRRGVDTGRTGADRGGGLFLAVALTLSAAGDRAVYAEDSLPECGHLTLDMQLSGSKVQPDTYYLVGNRTDETLTNIKVVVKSEKPAPRRPNNHQCLC